MKCFNTRTNIGKAKYVVNFHDGEKVHRDGSPFFDIHIDSDKRRFGRFVSSLKKSGFVER